VEDSHWVSWEGRGGVGRGAQFAIDANLTENIINNIFSANYN